MSLAHGVLYAEIISHCFSILIGYYISTWNKYAKKKNNINRFRRGIKYIPEVKKGAKEFIKKLNIDYDLILFTTRNSLEASRWLMENKIDKYFKNVTNVKIPAYLYLDDRAIGFSGDYKKTLEQIEDFKAHWKNP